MSTGDLIKSELLILYEKGLSKVEAYDEISKTHDRNTVSQKTVNKYFETFKADGRSLGGNIAKTSRKKLTDESLIALIEQNPDLSMTKLAVLAGTSQTTISRRIRQLNSSGKKVNYVSKKHIPNITDELLVDLVNKNPDSNTVELAKLANTSQSTISKKLRQLSANNETVEYVSKKHKLKFSDEFLIDLVNKNPDHSITQLAELTGISRSAIWSRIKQLSSRGEKLNYVCKKREYKYTDEFLINVINENPGLNMSELAKLVNVTTNSIFQRLKRINSEGINVSYINKSTLPSFTDEFLRNLIIKNPDLSVEDLAKVINTSNSLIIYRLKQIKGEIEGESCSKNHMSKFTDESLIELINGNPDFNMRELSKLLDTSPTTIRNRINKINRNGERIRYISKDFPKDKMEACDLSSLKSKLSDELLIDLVIKNSGLSVKELAKLANTSVRVISKMLKQIDWVNARNNYVDNDSDIVAKDRD